MLEEPSEQAVEQEVASKVFNFGNKKISEPTEK
jgi:hypothetical protein